jgi:hypothetical protein
MKYYKGFPEQDSSRDTATEKGFEAWDRKKDRGGDKVITERRKNGRNT